MKKTFVLAKQNIIEKCEGTEIQWNDGKNVTEKKVKKKQKPKKGQPGKTITKVVQQESFFNFFKTITMPEESELAGKDKKEEKDDDDENQEKDVGEQMDEDYDLGNEFKDQLIPLALEYFMEVIEEDDDDEYGSDDDDGHDDASHPKGGKGKGGDDSEEEDKPKGGKKGGKKGGDKEGAAAG